VPRNSKLFYHVFRWALQKSTAVSEFGVMISSGPIFWEVTLFIHIELMTDVCSGSLLPSLLNQEDAGKSISYEPSEYLKET
jgi:hypothetical protein